MNRALVNKLAQNDAKWRGIACKMTKDYDEAQDVVQEMYVKFLGANYDTDAYASVGDGLVILTMKNIWIDRIRKRESSKTVIIGEDYDVEDSVSNFEIEDNDLDYIERFKNLPMRQQELILESYDFSVREIADKLNINYVYVHRQIHKGLQDVLLVDYNSYKNSNLKFKK